MATVGAAFKFPFVALAAVIAKQVEARSAVATALAIRRIGSAAEGADDLRRIRFAWPDHLTSSIHIQR